MTRDEVMALTDEELRVKAAELAGWIECRTFTTLAAPLGMPPHPVDDGAFEVLPDYPHDIAAAWELVEKMKSDDMLPTVEFADGEWWCDWFGMEGPGNATDGDSAPRAITRAFVLAMSNEAH